MIPMISFFRQKLQRPDLLCLETLDNRCMYNFFFINPLDINPLLKKRLWRSCFPVDFEKLLRTSFLQNNSGRLLLLDKVCINSCSVKAVAIKFFAIDRFAVFKFLSYMRKTTDLKLLCLVV